MLSADDGFNGTTARSEAAGGKGTHRKALSLTRERFGITRGGGGSGNSRKFGVERVKWQWKSWVASFDGRRLQKDNGQGGGELGGDGKLMWQGGRRLWKSSSC